jgi:hypothetical protein
VAPSLGRTKLRRTRLAVHVETKLELLAVKAKDAKVGISRFRAGDEFDVDLMRLWFDVDIENTFIGRFGRLRPKAIAINENSAGLYHA